MKRKKVLGVLPVLFLAGCVSNPNAPQYDVSQAYDSHSSFALNVANAIGGEGLVEDSSIPEEDVAKFDGDNSALNSALDVATGFASAPLMGINPLMSVGLSLLMPSGSGVKWPMDSDWYVLRLDSKKYGSAGEMREMVQGDLRERFKKVLARELGGGVEVSEKIDGSVHSYLFAGAGCERFINGLGGGFLPDLYQTDGGCKVKFSGMTIMGPSSDRLSGGIESAYLLRFRSTLPAKYLFEQYGESLLYYMPRIKREHNAAVITGDRVYPFVRPVNGNEFSYSLKGSKYQQYFDRSF